MPWTRMAYTAPPGLVGSRLPGLVSQSTQSPPTCVTPPRLTRPPRALSIQNRGEIRSGRLVVKSGCHQGHQLDHPEPAAQAPVKEWPVAQWHQNARTAED